MATVTLPLFTTRRRHAVTCTNCGAKLERVLPGVAYYSLSFITGVLTESAFMVLLLFVILHLWTWIAVMLTGVFLINLAASAFLNSRTRVEFVDPADARRDKPGRWYPN
jgi:uncharacterized protein (DUF983 family)